MLALFRVAVVVLALGFCGYASIYTPPSNPEKNTPPPAAPPPVFPIQVEVLRGESVEIPLPDYGTGVRFVLRKLSAKYGEVSLLKWKNGRVAFLYKHSGQKENSADSFAYAAQSEGGVSPAATVSVAILDPKPILAAPNSVDFGTVMVGESTTRKIKIENRGGGTLVGCASAERPWRVEDGAYRLGAGQSCSIAVTFSPASESSYGGQLRFSSEPARATVLDGIGYFPVVTDSREVFLEEKEGRRSGSFELTNRTSQPRIVSLLGSEDIQMPREVEIPAKASRRVEITARQGKQGPVLASVTIMDARHAMELTVRAPATEPLLLTSPAKLTFNAPEHPLSIVLSNVGGSATRVTTRVPPPFQIDAADAVFDLQPNEKRKVQVTVRKNEQGHFRSSLSFGNGKRTIEVPVEAKIESPVAANSSGGTASVSNEMGSSKKSAAMDRAAMDNLPGSFPLLLAEAGSSWAEVCWQAPVAESDRSVLEMRYVRMEGDRLKIGWVPLENVELKAQSKDITAKIRGLQPRAVYTLRVVCTNKKGERVATSAALQLSTKQSVWEKITLLHVACITALFLLVLSLYSRKQANREDFSC